MARRHVSCKLVQQVGARIRFLRLELGWTLHTLAIAAESSISGLHAIETGQSMIRVDTLARIARALRGEPFELLNLDTEIDDVAYVIEKMRQDEGVTALVRVRLETCAVRVRVDCILCAVGPRP
ncbi:MAG TPA: helix-turn-helix transcriptional regulator, partial [Polyangium sp.]|nr:helix-turn-helix transcriptional regulator [Polyangium sp.]